MLPMPPSRCNMLTILCVHVSFAICSPNWLLWVCCSYLTEVLLETYILLCVLFTVAPCQRIWTSVSHRDERGRSEPLLPSQDICGQPSIDPYVQIPHFPTCACVYHLYLFVHVNWFTLSIRVLPLASFLHSRVMLLYWSMCCTSLSAHIVSNTYSTPVCHYFIVILIQCFSKSNRFYRSQILHTFKIFPSAFQCFAVNFLHNNDVS